MHISIEQSQRTSDMSHLSVGVIYATEGGTVFSPVDGGDIALFELGGVRIVEREYLRGSRIWPVHGSVTISNARFE